MLFIAHFLEAFDNKIEVLDPFFNCNKYYIEYDQNMHIMIFKEGYNERKNIINNFSFSKEEYERNLCLFFDNIELICEHLLKCTPEFDGIQFFRNLKSIIFGKNNLIELIQNEGDRNKLLVKCKELTYCWNTFLNRLMYIVMTKKKQNDRLSKLTADIKKKEIDILRCL